MEEVGRSIRAVRRQAELNGQLIYVNPRPCRRGHSERYTNGGRCVQCARDKNTARYIAKHGHRPRPAAPVVRPAPKPDRVVDWNYLTEGQKAIWYMRVDSLKKGRQKRYRHHPLEERAIFCGAKNTVRNNGVEEAATEGSPSDAKAAHS